MNTLLFGAVLSAAVPADAQNMPSMTMPPISKSTATASSDALANSMRMPAHDVVTMRMADDDVVTGSGTSRLPAATQMIGLHLMSGDWMLMVHGYAWGALTGQTGPRGQDGTYVQSMAMVEATRNLTLNTKLQLRAMLSLDPLMGERGYPNLFATGESAYALPLVDRQHPHDFFMELSARVDRDLGPGSLFFYGGLPGEPALGPSAFMHRPSARLITQAPISHHWFDSTHISFGVLTVGYSTKRWQIEGSVFNGREPGEDRWNIETGKLDSWSLRGTITPGNHWTAEISYGNLKQPERLHPGINEQRLIGSVSYSRDRIDLTGGISIKSFNPGHTLDAVFGEATYALTGRHAMFGRVESLSNDELFDDNALSSLQDHPFRVTRFTAGYAYSLPFRSWATLALGAEGSAFAKSSKLDQAYGKKLVAATAFAKLMLGQ